MNRRGFLTGLISAGPAIVSYKNIMPVPYSLYDLCDPEVLAFANANSQAGHPEWMESTWNWGSALAPNLESTKTTALAAVRFREAYYGKWNIGPPPIYKIVRRSEIRPENNFDCRTGWWDKRPLEAYSPAPEWNYCVAKDAEHLGWCHGTLDSAKPKMWDQN